LLIRLLFGFQNQKEDTLMARPRARDLTERELEVMHAFWNQEGDATAAEIRDRLAATSLDRAYTTVATLVRNLYDKGFLAQVNDARPFRYRVSRSFEEISERFLGDLIQRVFQGSREQLFVRLFKQRKLTAQERAVLNRVLKEDGP
jgi:BlaI family penicillinase repressor